MYLQKTGTIKETKIDINFEKVVDDLLMISIINESQSANVLNYWRLTKTDKIPPLEIGVDCKSKCLANITFFIDSTCLLDSDEVNVPIKKGTVLVDTSIFTCLNEYLDVYQSYSVQIQKDKVTCFFEKGTQFKCSYKTDKLEIYLNYQEKIVGFSVCGLSYEQIDMIRSL